ncbi:hypothetical protein HK102_000536 [Quaeritorhiza haematococci]|nr:hypothetical protein HK102_000536 [Quaeritorhiza haematococci]
MSGFDQKWGLVHTAIGSVTWIKEEDFTDIYEYIIKETSDEGLTDALIYAITCFKDYVRELEDKNIDIKTPVVEKHLRIFHMIMDRLLSRKTIKHEVAWKGRKGETFMYSLFRSFKKFPDTAVLGQVKHVLALAASSVLNMDL